MLSAFYDALVNHSDIGQTLYRIRDLTCLKIDKDFEFVFACDSLGGIGQKPLDQVFATPRTVGHFSLRVPLFEVLGAGARPFLIIDTLSVEAGPYGQAILEAIKELAATIGLTDPIHFNGSMEKNLFPQQTGVGVTVVGIASANSLHIGSARAGDTLILAGKPKSAPKYEVRVDDPEFISVYELQWLRNKFGVRDVVPIGSRGVAGEAQDLADSCGLFAEVSADLTDIHQSGGPHTAVLAACEPSVLADIQQTLNCPVLPIGTLKSM